MSEELKPCLKCGRTPTRMKYCGKPSIQHQCVETADLSVHISIVGTSEKIVTDEWYRRAQSDNPPLTLDELRQMDGEPVWIVENGKGHWELSTDANDYFEDRDEAFYGMTCNGKKDGLCSASCKSGEIGLHQLGWLAYRRKLEVQDGN